MNEPTPEILVVGRKRVRQILEKLTSRGMSLQETEAALVGAWVTGLNDAAEAVRSNLGPWSPPVDLLDSGVWEELHGDALERKNIRDVFLDRKAGSD